MYEIIGFMIIVLLLFFFWPVFLAFGLTVVFSVIGAFVGLVIAVELNWEEPVWGLVIGAILAFIATVKFANSKGA